MLVIKFGPGERVVIALLLSSCSLFTEGLVVFHLAKIDTMEKCALFFIVIRNFKSYFVICWIMDPNQCICNGFEYE